MTPLPVTAAILAGGQSLRMGQDKAKLLHRGKPLIQRLAEALTPAFDEVLLSVNESGRYAKLGLPEVVDATPDAGPLAALASIFAAARHDTIVLTACDIANPDIDLLRELIERSANADGALPICNGRIQPLFAVYRRDRLNALLDACMQDGNRAMFQLFTVGDFRTLPVPAKRIQNINTRADYEALQQEQ